MIFKNHFLMFSKLLTKSSYYFPNQEELYVYIKFKNKMWSKVSLKKKKRISQKIIKCHSEPTPQDQTLGIVLDQRTRNSRRKRQPYSLCLDIYEENFQHQVARLRETLGFIPPQLCFSGSLGPFACWYPNSSVFSKIPFFRYLPFFQPPDTLHC